MFDNLSTITKVLATATALGAVATVVSAVVDHRGVAECCCEEECCDCCCEELADPTAEM